MPMWKPKRQFIAFLFLITTLMYIMKLGTCITKTNQATIMAKYLFYVCMLVHNNILIHTVKCHSFANQYTKYKNEGKMADVHLGSMEGMKFLRMNRIKSKWKDISKDDIVDIWLLTAMHTYSSPSHDNGNDNHDLRWREGHLLLKVQMNDDIKKGLSAVIEVIQYHSILA